MDETMIATPFFMCYAVSHVSSSLQATISQRTPEGWIYLRTMHRDMAVREVKFMNDKLRLFYLEQGHNVRFPTD